MAVLFLGQAVKPSSGQAQASSPAQVVAIRAGTLIDGKGGAPIHNAVIVIRGDRIESVGSTVPDGARVIDLSNQSVLPGFIDAHVHLTGRPIGEGDWTNAVVRESIADDAIFGVRAARATLEAGFTTVRNVGARGFADVALRNAINAGRVPGPRMLVAGHAIGSTGGHCDDTDGFIPQVLGGQPGPLDGVANGDDQVREAVRLQAKYGADVIKICATGGVLSQGDAIGAQQLTEEEMRTAVETAHLLGRRVAAHAHGVEGIMAASRAGVTSVEHGSFMTEEAARLMVRNGTWHVPTLLAGYSLAGSDSALARLPAFVQPKARAAWAAMQHAIRISVQAGVKIALGTDAGVYPHGQNGKEFELMVTYGGMTPMQSIQAGTMNAATLLGMEHDVGSVEAGKFADLVAVNGDPIADIAILQHPAFVMKGGEVVFTR